MSTGDVDRSEGDKSIASGNDGWAMFDLGRLP